MIFKENILDVDTYLMLRNKVNWKPLTKEQAVRALDNTLYNVVAYEKDKPIGMGRVVGDGAVICYVQDLVIIPECQGKGAGHVILQMIKEYVFEHKIPGTEIMLDLMCAKGREEFYKKNGFIERPTGQLGPGMIQKL